MQFVPFVNTIKLEAVFINQGEYVENVHHFVQGNPPAVEDMQALAEAYVTFFNAYLKGTLHSACSLVAVKCTDLTAQNSPGIEYTTGLPIAGTGQWDPMPNSVTIAVKWITALRGRSYRGRTYHVALSEQQVQGNALTSGYHTALTTAYGNLIYLVNGERDWFLAVATRVSGGVPRTQGEVHGVIAHTVDPVIDSQRRRLPGRGK